MFRVFSTRDGKPYAHAVKALRIIWTHLPQLYVSFLMAVSDLMSSVLLHSNERNTIHIDDLASLFR